MDRMYGGYGRMQKKLDWQKYILPAGIALTVLLLGVSFCSRKGSDAEKTGSFIEATPLTSSSITKIVYNGSNEAQIEKTEKVFADEKVVSEKGTASIGIPSTSSSYRLKERARVRFLGIENGTYLLQVENSEVWAKEQNGTTKFKMTFLDVIPALGSVVNLYQNQIGSTVYVISGSAQMSTKTQSGVVLTAGNKITLLSGNTEVDLSSKIEPIDEAFRQDAWFSENGGVLSYTAPSASGTISTFSSEVKPESSAKNLVLIESPADNSSATESKIIVSGKATSTKVKKVSIGNVESPVASDLSFSLSGVTLSEGVNDLVWRAIDEAGEILQKGVLSVSLPVQKKTATTISKTVAYPISDKDYRIITPASNPYITTENFIRIKGEVPGGIVEKIMVNDYQINKSFRAGGTSWYFYAATEFGTLADGMNLYKIQYFGKDGSLLHEALFTIVKQAVGSKTVASSESKISQ